MADVLLKVLDADGTAQTLVTEQSGTSDKIPVHRAQGPGGAALSTAAKQDTGNTSLAGILAASGGVDMTAVTTTAGAALNAILFTADTTNFAAVSVQILGTFVGTVTFEGSNDNVNWSTVTGNSLASGTSTTGASAPGMYFIASLCRYIRVRVSAYTSGSITSSVYLIDEIVAPGQATVSAVLNGGGNVIGAAILATSPSSTAGALTRYSLASAATTNANNVKATAGRIYGGILFNTSAATKFVKLYNKATAPTVGTDTPLLTIPIAANSKADLASIVAAVGLYFSSGISIAITGAFADSDTTAVAANDVLVQLLYA